MTKKDTVFRRSLLASAIALSITACGGSDSNSSGSSTNSAQTGVFLDSAVGGVSYKTETEEGKTNEKGEYKFKQGETVTFSIGSLTLPPVKALGVLTPRDIGSADVATLIAQVLQSLDADNDPTNGITINDAVHTAASGLAALDFTSATFEADNQAHLSSLMAASGSGRTTLVSAVDANAHLDSTIVANLPTKFSTAWLANRTLYALYFEEGQGVVQKTVFNSDATQAVVSNTLNSEEDGTHPITINADGYLLDGGNKGERIACDGTKDYIQIHYISDGMFESVDRWYFDKDKAVAYANSLSASIPIGTCEIDAKAIANPHTLADLNGRSVYGVWFDDEDNDGNDIIETAVIIKETYADNNAAIEILYGHDVGFTITTGITVESERLTYAIDKTDQPNVTQGSKIICSNTQYFKSHWMTNEDNSSVEQDGVDYWFFDEFSARSYVNSLGGATSNPDTTCTEQP